MSNNEQRWAFEHSYNCVGVTMEDESVVGQRSHAQYHISPDSIAPNEHSRRVFEYHHLQ